MELSSNSLVFPPEPLPVPPVEVEFIEAAAAGVAAATAALFDTESNATR